jgi:hypothetical protein
MHLVRTAQVAGEAFGHDPLVQGKAAEGTSPGATRSAVAAVLVAWGSRLPGRLNSTALRTMRLRKRLADLVNTKR